MTAAVFLTGLPRCGTSWIGETLADRPGVRYLYEPLNHAWVKPLKGELAHFTYLAAGQRCAPRIANAADRAFAGRQGPRQLARAARRGYLRSATRRGGAVLIKDPSACLMTEWIAERYQSQVLVVLRHPCGFASSMSSLGWKLSLARLLDQETLMRDHLARYEQDLRMASADPWHGRGAFWAAVYTVLGNQLQAHPDWLSCRFEVLCADPEGQFGSLAGKLGLPPGGRELRPARPDSYRAGPASTRRDSRSVAEAWKQKLSAGQIDAVLGVVRDFGLQYDAA